MNISLKQLIYEKLFIVYNSMNLNIKVYYQVNFIYYYKIVVF